MDSLLWVWKQAWQLKFDATREKAGDEPFNVNGDDPLGDLREWERYAEMNYQDQLPQYPSMVCLVVVVMLTLVVKS